jgi:hypothetical protein
MMRPYEWGSLTQEIGRRPTNIDDFVNGGNRNGIAERGCRGLVPITTGLKRKVPGVSTWAILTIRQGRCLEDSMMMNPEAYDNSLKQYIQTKYGVPMSVYSDKHTTDQSTAKLSIQGGLNNSVPLSEFEKGLKELGMEALHANSLQAKNRLKWLFRTLQDQLVKEMRLRGVRTIEEGHWFLEASLPLYHKTSLTCPRGENKLHKPLTKGLHLDTTYNEIYVHSEPG